MKWAVTRLCRPTGYGDYLWAGRPMFSAVGLFLGIKSKISHEQNVNYFQFYIRLPNCRLLGSIIFKKSPIRSIPLSILYRLFFETQGRKYGRILSWSWLFLYFVQNKISHLWHSATARISITLLIFQLLFTPFHSRLIHFHYQTPLTIIL